MTEEETFDMEENNTNIVSSQENGGIMESSEINGPIASLITINGERPPITSVNLPKRSGSTNNSNGSTTNSSTSNSNGLEHGFFANLSRIELTYYFQIGIIYIVVITAIINLSFSHDEGKLWSSLLSSSIGYLLPHPTIPKKRMNYQSSSEY